MEPEFFGIAVRSLSVTLPNPGDYTVVAELVGCDAAAFTTEPIPIRVQSANETRAVQISGRGAPRSWRFEYYGITQELSGNQVLKVGSTQPWTLTNVSMMPFEPCRLMLGAQLQVMELIGDKWVEGKQFQFPEGLSTLGPGETVALEAPRVRVIQAKAEDEPEPTAHVLKISVLPPKGSYQHLVAVEDSMPAGPFPGFCDAYYVDFEWPKSDLVD